VRGKELVTPSLYLGILEGITRDVVMGLASKAGLISRELPFTRHDLFNADEVFLTGTAAEIVPITKIYGRSIANGKPGPYTGKLISLFRRLTKSECTPIV